MPHNAHVSLHRTRTVQVGPPYPKPRLLSSHACMLAASTMIHPSIHPWTRGRLRHSSQWCRCTLLALGIAMHIDSRGATAGTSSGLRHTDRTAHRRATRMGSRARTLPRQCSLTPVLTRGTTRRGNPPHHTHARTHAQRHGLRCSAPVLLLPLQPRGRRQRGKPHAAVKGPAGYRQGIVAQGAQAAHDVTKQLGASHQCRSGT